jgi:hypothetical protein
MSPGSSREIHRACGIGTVVITARIDAGQGKQDHCQLHGFFNLIAPAHVGIGVVTFLRTLPVKRFARLADNPGQRVELGNLPVLPSEGRG